MTLAMFVGHQFSLERGYPNCPGCVQTPGMHQMVGRDWELNLTTSFNPHVHASFTALNPRVKQNVHTKQLYFHETQSNIENSP